MKLDLTLAEVGALSALAFIDLSNWRSRLEEARVYGDMERIALCEQEISRMEPLVDKLRGGDAQG